MKEHFGLGFLVLFLIAGSAVTGATMVAARYSSMQYDAGMIAGEWKGRAETYQGIMDQQVRTMKALTK